MKLAMLDLAAMNEDPFPYNLHRTVPGKFNLRALNYGADPFDLGRRFTAAWYGVEYRWTDCWAFHQEYLRVTEEFTHPLSNGGLDYQKRCYEQEKFLFSFLFLGLSALETFIYGLFFCAARRYPAQFPLKHEDINLPSIEKPAKAPKPKKSDEPKKSEEPPKRIPISYREITINKVAMCFCNELPADPLSELLNELRYDKPLVEWRKLRDEFTHRHTPFRHSEEVRQTIIESLDSGSANDTFSANDTPALRKEYLVLSDKRKVRLDMELTATHIDWLAGWLEKLIKQTDFFIETHYANH